MTSRTVAAVVLGLVVLLIAGTATAAAGSRASKPRDRDGRGTQPNIVLVMTDDQALSMMRREVMPNVTELLADQGTSFDRAYLTTPLCCPSRATLLTGQYGHNNGVLRNVYDLLKDKNNVLPVWLRQAGYVTAHVGKFMNLYRRGHRELAPAPGWSEWHTLVWSGEENYYVYDMSVNGKRVHHGQDPRDYSTRVFNRTSKRLIRRYIPRSRPLFLEVDEVAPHPARFPHPVPACNPPPDPRDAGLFNDEPLPQPPSFNEHDVSDKPAFMRSVPLLNNNQITRMTRTYRCGLAALRGVDRTVGRIYDEIKRLGELGRTVFIFYSDNGMLYGEHRIPGGKLNPYEEAASTPLIMRVPSRYLPGHHPAVAHVAAPVANIDLAPTIIRLADAKPCPPRGRCRTMDGRSLTALLAGRTPAWAEERPIGIELGRVRGKKNHAVCRYDGVRSFNQVLIRHRFVAEDFAPYKCIRDDQWERYDLTNDPFELNNLCVGGDVANCPVSESEQRLRKLMWRIHDCAGIAGRDPRPASGHYCD
jgi:N-acetylglucosamine-6-sulfatase